MRTRHTTRVLLMVAPCAGCGRMEPPPPVPPPDPVEAPIARDIPREVLGPFEVHQRARGPSSWRKQVGCHPLAWTSHHSPQGYAAEAGAHGLAPGKLPIACGAGEWGLAPWPPPSGTPHPLLAVAQSSHTLRTLGLELDTDRIEALPSVPGWPTAPGRGAPPSDAGLPAAEEMAWLHLGLVCWPGEGAWPWAAEAALGPNNPCEFWLLPELSPDGGDGGRRAYRLGEGYRLDPAAGEEPRWGEKLLPALWNAAPPDGVKIAVELDALALLPRRPPTPTAPAALPEALPPPSDLLAVGSAAAGTTATAGPRAWTRRPCGKPRLDCLESPADATDCENQREYQITWRRFQDWSQALGLSFTLEPLPEGAEASSGWILALGGPDPTAEECAMAKVLTDALDSGLDCVIPRGGEGLDRCGLGTQEPQP